MIVAIYKSGLLFLLKDYVEMKSAKKKVNLFDSPF